MLISKKLGENPDSTTIYRTLATKKRQQHVSNLPDFEVMNEYFANTGSNMPEIQVETDIDKLEKTMVVHQTNALPLLKTILQMLSTNAFKTKHARSVSKLQVIPQHKKRVKKDPSNYRPISL